MLNIALKSEVIWQNKRSMAPLRMNAELHPCNVWQTSIFTRSNMINICLPYRQLEHITRKVWNEDNEKKILSTKNGKKYVNFLNYHKWTHF